MRARLAQELLIVLETVQRTFKLVTVAACQLAAALFAAHVFGVHELSAQIDVLAHDWSLANAADTRDRIDLLDARGHAGQAVDVFALFVDFVLEALEIGAARAATEVIGMEVLAPRIDALVHDDVAARLAARTEQVVKVFGAIGLIVVDQILAAVIVSDTSNRRTCNVLTR